MGRCSVPGCSDHELATAIGIPFHKFPMDSKLRREWIAIIGNKKLSVNMEKYQLYGLRVCGKHFKPSDYQEDFKHKIAPHIYKPRNLLKKDAVPSIFPMELTSDSNKSRRRKARRSSSNSTDIGKSEEDAEEFDGRRNTLINGIDFLNDVLESQENLAFEFGQDHVEDSCQNICTEANLHSIDDIRTLPIDGFENEEELCSETLADKPREEEMVLNSGDVDDLAALGTEVKKKKLPLPASASISSPSDPNKATAPENPETSSGDFAPLSDELPHVSTLLLPGTGTKPEAHRHFETDSEYLNYTAVDAQKAMYNTKTFHQCSVCSEIFDEYCDLEKHNKSHYNHGGSMEDNEEILETDFTSSTNANKEFSLQNGDLPMKNRSKKCIVNNSTKPGCHNKSSNIPRQPQWRVCLREKQFVCDICDRVLKSRCALVSHKKSHSSRSNHSVKDSGESIGIKKAINGKQTYFKCEICGKSFDFKSLLDLHKRTHGGV